MARIAGVDLPKQKRGLIGLTYIFGIGSTTAKEILHKAGYQTNTLPEATFIPLMQNFSNKR